MLQGQRTEPLAVQDGAGAGSKGALQLFSETTAHHMGLSEEGDEAETEVKTFLCLGYCFLLVV